MQQFTWDLHGMTVREALEVAQKKIEWLQEGEAGERSSLCGLIIADLFIFDICSQIRRMFQLHW